MPVEVWLAAQKNARHAIHWRPAVCEVTELRLHVLVHVTLTIACQAGVISFPLQLQEQRC